MFSSGIATAQTIPDSIIKKMQSIPSDSGKIVYLNRMIDTLNIQLAYNVAHQVAIQSVQLADKLNSKILKGDAYFQFGEVLKGEYQIDSALSYFNKSLEQYRGSDNKVKEAQAMIKLAWLHARSDYQSSINDFTKALKLGQQAGDSIIIAISYWGFAENYIALGNLQAAITYGFKSLSVLEKTDNYKLLARVHSCLGFIYDAQNNRNEALKSYQTALGFARKCNDLFQVSYILTFIGDIYILENKYDEALNCYTQSYKLGEQLQEQSMMAINYEKVGDVFIYQGDQKLTAGKIQEANEFYHNALKNYLLSTKLNIESGYQISVAGSYYKLGTVYLKLKNYKECKANIDKGLALINVIKAMNVYQQMLLLTSDYYKATGDFRNSFEYYKQYIAYRDSMVNEQNTRKTVQTQMQYDFDKKQAIAKAEQDKKDAINEEKMLRQRHVRNTSFVGLGITLVFLSLLYRQRNRISKEKKRSDDLLLNILPEETAEELKNTGKAKAKKFDAVTVLFTDFKDFTTTSEKLSAEELVDEINQCYSAFDAIIAKHNVEKIKTIGDSYMCAGGLPVPNNTHPDDVVNAGLEILQFVKQHNLKNISLNKVQFEIRIGIHTGPVVAGIVGTRKFAYDIWGDTVNTASRIESGGEPGKVNISGVTYALVNTKFNCTYRGKIPVKNKGEIDMYFVECSKISDEAKINSQELIEKQS